MNRSASWPPAAGAITGLLVVALYLLVGVFDHSIWAPVEPTIAGVVWNMVEHGHLAVPMVNETPFVEKPPFYYWLAWAVSAATGRLDAGTIRLPAALMGIGCLGLIFGLSRRLYGSRVACLTTLLGALCLMFWDSAHRAASDISATFFAFVCFALFTRGLDDPRANNEDHRQPWDLAFCVALAASFYAKNVFTFFLVLPPISVMLLANRQPRRLAAILGITAGLLVALLLPWIVLVYREGGLEQLRIIFFDNTIGRFLSIAEYVPQYSTSMSDALLAEKEPLYFYASRLFAYPLPWTPLVLVAAVDLFRAKGSPTAIDRFLRIGLVTIPLALSLSSSKSTDYMIPILFFDFLIIARFLSELSSGARELAGWERWLLLVNILVAIALMAVFPLVLFAIFGGIATLTLVPLAFLVAGWLARRLREAPVDDRFVFDFCATALLAATAGLAIAIPAVDEQKSYEPFFDEVRPIAANRPIVTTFHEISRLPLVNYYLDTHVTVIQDFAPVAELLRGDTPIAAFIRCAKADEEKDTLDAIPGLILIREGQRGQVCFVANA